MKLPFLPNHDDASFFSFLTRQHPELTPGGRRSPEVPAAPHEPARPLQSVTVPHATTVLAVKYQEGVVIAGDRRATEGFQIAERRIEKVFKIDDYSAMAIAGAAYARLFGRAANNKSGGWLFGAAFGFAVWAAGAVLILPLVSGGKAPAGEAALGVFLSLVLWGGALGVLVPFVHRPLHANLEEVSKLADVGPTAAAANGRRAR